MTTLEFIILESVCILFASIFYAVWTRIHRDAVKYWQTIADDLAEAVCFIVFLVFAVSGTIIPIIALLLKLDILPLS